MSFTIAVAGKGGVGKTSIAGLLISRLAAHSKTPVLAVDADPNSCLPAVLGIEVDQTIGRIREEAREIARQGMGSGISKQDLLELKINESLVESEDFDLIAMGRSEGPGCYCYANNVLKAAMTRLADDYPFVVLDNEAGLENLSRRLAPDVDLFVLVTDPSQQGRQTVARLYELSREMGIEARCTAVLINRLRTSELPPDSEELRQTVDSEILIGLPDDDDVAAFAASGQPLSELPPTNPVSAGIDQLLIKSNIIASTPNEVSS